MAVLYCCSFMYITSIRVIMCTTFAPCIHVTGLPLIHCTFTCSLARLWFFTAFIRRWPPSSHHYRPGQVRNKLNEQLTAKFGIEHRLTTPYHPQANGLDERYNQTLVNSLSKFAQDNRETWVGFLLKLCTATIQLFNLVEFPQL